MSLNDQNRYIIQVIGVKTLYLNMVHVCPETRGGLNDLRVDTMITKWELGKSERTHHPPPT